MKRSLAFILACVMLIAVIPAASFAKENPFADVPAGAWFTDGALYCYEKGYMSGTSDTTFSPNAPTTRAMFVRILASVAGADLSGYKNSSSFSDVTVGSWYAASVEWAYKNGLSSGVGGGRFDPNGTVTREQVATFLLAFAKFMKFDASDSAKIDVYTDCGSVSSWAEKGVKWAVGAGLISGVTDFTLCPQDNCTRAQIALMIKKFITYYTSECDHKWSEATCTKGQVCSKCGYTRGAPLGHTTQNGKCERCGELHFVNNDTKLRYYIQKRGEYESIGSEMAYRIVREKDMKLSDGDTVTIVSGLYLDGDNPATGEMWIALSWRYTDGDIMEIQISIPYLSDYYEFGVLYYLSEYNDTILIGKGGLRASQVNSSYKVRITDSDYDQKDVDEFVDEASELLTLGLSAFNQSIVKGVGLGGLTMKDFGFINY